MDTAGYDIVINKCKEFAGLMLPQVNHTNNMQGKITDMQGCQIGPPEKIPDLPDS